MNKELEALEYIENFNNKRFFNIKYDNGDQAHYEYQTIKDLFPKEFGLIETALKRLEEHDKLFKKYDINDNWLEPALYVIKNHFPMDTETQLKKLKAFEIVAEKDVDGGWLRRAKDLHEYNNGMGINSYSALTQEEYELLKEVLL